MHYLISHYFRTDHVMNQDDSWFMSYAAQMPFTHSNWDLIPWSFSWYPVSTGHLGEQLHRPASTNDFITWAATSCMYGCNSIYGGYNPSYPCISPFSGYDSIYDHRRSPSSRQRRRSPGLCTSFGDSWYQHFDREIESEQIWSCQLKISWFQQHAVEYNTWLHWLVVYKIVVKSCYITRCIEMDEFGGWHWECCCFVA